MLNEADKLFQQDLVRSMASAYALGLLEEDATKVQVWVRRCDALLTVAANVYGVDVARSLLDQAQAEGMVLGPQMLARLGALLPPSETGEFVPPNFSENGV